MALPKLKDPMPIAASVSAIDTQFINSIALAVIDTVSSMAGITFTRDSPSLRSASEMCSLPGDVSGVVPMNSQKFLGSFSLSFEKSTILAIHNAVLGENVTSIDTDVLDCVAELTNIIFGAAKRDINTRGHTIFPAIPTVINGPRYKVHHSPGGVILCLPFSSAVGGMMVECIVDPILG